MANASIEVNAPSPSLIGVHESPPSVDLYRLLEGGYEWIWAAM